MASYRRLMQALVALGTLAGPLERAAVAEPGDGEAPASVLGLEADDASRGTALTDALRRAFARRGLSGGAETTFVQLRQSLGCSGDDPSCLRGGGSMLGARRLIYGQLGSDGAGAWTLDLTMLEVETERVITTSSVLGPDDLEPGSIDATAERLAAALVPEVSTSSVDVPPPPVQQPAPATPGPATEAPPPPAPEPATEAPAPRLASDDPAPRQRKREFGFHRPMPTWKWVGFGTSAGLFAVSLGSAIGMGVWLTGPNGFRAELLDAADNSLTDDNPANDIDPNLPAETDLCTVAESRPTDADGMPLGQEGDVTNASIVGLCQDGERVRRAQMATAGVAVVSGVSTVVFTALLFVRPRRSGAASAWRRHRLHVGVDPTGRGLALRLGGRF